MESSIVLIIFIIIIINVLLFFFGILFFFYKLITRKSKQNLPIKTTNFHEEKIQYIEEDYESGEEIAYHFLKVAGPQFKSTKTGESRQKLLKRLKDFPEPIFLERDYSNPYDSNAIVVITPLDEDLGFIYKEDQSKLLPYLDNDHFEVIVKLDRFFETHHGLNAVIKVNIYKS